MQIVEGSRKPLAFVALDCPAIPDVFFESDLLGSSYSVLKWRTDKYGLKNR
jgi:transcriptional regulator of aromatic amino acid metabolism